MATSTTEPARGAKRFIAPDGACYESAALGLRPTATSGAFHENSARLEQSLKLNGWNKPINAEAILKSLLESGTVTIQHGQRGFQVMIQLMKPHAQNLSVVEKDLDGALGQMWVNIRQTIGDQGGA